jgi:hypothetical protein
LKPGFHFIGSRVESGALSKLWVNWIQLAQGARLRLHARAALHHHLHARRHELAGGVGRLRGSVRSYFSFPVRVIIAGTLWGKQSEQVDEDGGGGGGLKMEEEARGNRRRR